MFRSLTKLPKLPLLILSSQLVSIHRSIVGAIPVIKFNFNLIADDPWSSSTPLIRLSAKAPFAHIARYKPACIQGLIGKLPTLQSFPNCVLIWLSYDARLSEDVPSPLVHGALRATCRPTNRVRGLII